jgi:hypothetical protein
MVGLSLKLWFDLTMLAINVVGKSLQFRRMSMSVTQVVGPRTSAIDI